MAKEYLLIDDNAKKKMTHERKTAKEIVAKECSTA
jgi:hypothetical protein